MREPHFSFENALLKVKWANKHIDQLESVFNRFIENDLDLSIVETESDNARLVGYTRVQEPPEEITLILGDAVHSLRASLDYCWMGLARAVDPETKKFTIPVPNNKKGAETEARNSAVGQAFPAVVGLLANKICLHADFSDGGNKPLIIVNKLSNWEKHNLIILMRQEITSGTISVKNASFGTIHISNNTIGGAVPTLIRFSGFGPEMQRSEVKTKDHATAQIVFGKHDLVEGEPIFPLMRNLSQAVAEAVQAFIETFPVLKT